MDYDQDYAELIAQFHEEFDEFREQLDKRTESEVERDRYILDQKSKGKRWKVVFKKASKKLDFKALGPSDSEYDYWVGYYETFIRMLIRSVDLESFAKNIAKLKEIDQRIAEISEEIARGKTD
ncbi:MAG: hypothetical protein AAF546_15090 [Verrucomicrobiota bacterium]